MPNQSKHHFDSNITLELFNEMCKARDPPTMNEFPEIYVLALNKLQSKVNDEEANIRLFEQNTTQLNELLATNGSNRSIKNERQFVFKVNVVEGIYSENPIFQLNIDTNESAEIPFSEFEGGDAMLSLPMAANSIQVTVLKEDRQPAYVYQIELGEFGDKRRQIKHSAGRYDNQDVVVEFEGQIIYNQHDYHKGLLYINNQKIEESKQNKYDFTRMRDDLLGLFKDQNLRASVVRDSPSNRASVPLTSSQFEVAGPTPVLRNSQISANFISKEFRVSENPGSSIRSYQQTGPVVTTQPKEFGMFNSPGVGGIGGIKSQAQQMARDIIPKNKLSWSPWVHTLFYLNLGLLIVSFFVNWNRASFLSMVMAIVYSTWYLVREDFDSLLPGISLVVGYALALAFDLVWLIQSSRHLWTSGLYIHDGSLAGLDKFMIIMSYIIVGVEAAAIAVSVLLWRGGMFTNANDVALKTVVPMRF